MIEATVTLNQPQSQSRQFIATSREHSVVIDDAAGNTGAKPIELVAMGLAGCTAFDVINILRKKRLHISGYRVQVRAEQAQAPPQIFTLVNIHHVVSGSDLTAEAVESAIRLSEEKYCSVGAMVRKSAEITTTYELIDTELGDMAEPVAPEVVHVG